MKTMTLKDRIKALPSLLPLADDYGTLIRLVGDTDENRKKYGRHTYAQWHEVLAERNLLSEI